MTLPDPRVPVFREPADRVQALAPSQLQPLPPTLRLDSPHDPRGLGALLALAEGAPRPLPLQSVWVRAAIAGDCCRTVIEQRFFNPLEINLEAVHIFPLPEDGAVVEMELRAGDVTVRAECRERAEAVKVFEAAREAGHRAGLLTQERADVHTLRVTNLPPRTEVTVRIVVVEKLECVDGQFRWRFPTVIAPRYLPGQPIGHAGLGVVPDTDHVPDASHLQPPLRLEGGTALDLEVEIAGPVTALASSLHAVRVDLDGGVDENAVGNGGAVGAAGSSGAASGSAPAPRVRVAPAGNATLDRDFVLAFSTAAPETTVARAWTDGAFTQVVIEPPAGLVPPALPRDAVFVVDVSGSMQGAKIDAARRALSSALHGLSVGDRFRLVAFNHEMTAFQPEFAAYTQAALEQADRWIASLAAEGGTEMLPPIQAALGGEMPAGRLRTVLFITDGQAWNEAELVAAVAHRRGEAQFFCMGIDTAVNSALLRRLARVGGGTCELLTPRDNIEAAVAALEARLGSPIALDIRIEGGEPASDAPLVLFAGRPASMMVAGAPEQLRVTGRTAEGMLQLDLAPVHTSFPLGALWARDRVAALEDRMTLRPFEEEALRPEILRIALAHGIASRYTAFVAVDRSVTAAGERVEVVQPVELPLGWDPAFLGNPPGVYAAAAAPMSMGMHLQMRSIGTRGRAGSVRTSFRKLSDILRPPAVSAPMDADGGGLLSDHDVAADHAPDALSGLHESPLSMPAARPSAAETAENPAAEALAQRQMADGSFGGDVARTAAALVALIFLGNTRRVGLRRRVVAKAAAWLAEQAGAPLADLALRLLASFEAGTSPRLMLDDFHAQAGRLTAAGEEGEMLDFVMRGAAGLPGVLGGEPAAGER